MGRQRWDGHGVRSHKLVGIAQRHNQVFQLEAMMVQRVAEDFLQRPQVVTAKAAATTESELTPLIAVWLVSAAILMWNLECFHAQVA